MPQLDFFCKAPFGSAIIATTGELAPCCEYISHESDLPQYHVKDFDHWWRQGLTALRDRMIKDEVDPGCRHCRQKESNPRELNLRRHTNCQIKQTNQSLIQAFTTGSARTGPEVLEIRLGNLCNLGCIMCSAVLSSTIAAEVAHNRDKFAQIDIHEIAMPSPWWKDPQHWHRALDLASQARYLHLSGGEPFMHPGIKQLLQVLHPECSLSASTNLTLLDDEIIGLLMDRSPNTRLVWSVEGIEAHDEYVRWPTRWADIEHTLSRLQGMQIQAHHVLQHTSVFALPALLDWIHQHKIPIVFGRVYDRSVDGSPMLTLNSVSPTDYDRFSAWLSTYQGSHRDAISGWARDYSFDRTAHDRFRRYVNTLDSIRGTDFAATFAVNWHE